MSQPSSTIPNWLRNASIPSRNGNRKRSYSRRYKHLRYIPQINFLVDQFKCRRTYRNRKPAKRFLALFLSQVDQRYKWTSLDEVQEFLEKSWWVEDDELINEMYLMCYENRFPHYRPRGHIVVNILSKHLVYRMTRPKQYLRSLEDEVSWEELPEDALVEKFCEESLDFDFFKDLSYTDCVALYLHHAENFTAEESARILGICEQKLNIKLIRIHRLEKFAGLPPRVNQRSKKE